MIASLLAFALAAPPPKLELKDGDRIVWIGNTLVEREQRYGYWETALLAANADKNITFRNLGWSGDTVFGDARAGFDNPAKGYERLVNLTLELKPTVIFVSYGSNEAFEGEAGLEKFEKGLTKLLESLKPSKAQIVLFTPIPAVESLKDHNRNLARYAEMVRNVAGSQSAFLADLHKQFPQGLIPSQTENGMHFTGDGYGFNTDLFLKSLGHEPKANPAKLVALAPTVVAKNQLFFYKWRPQNETYLFGFRKHEQGKNAKEVVEFDPLIEAAEKQIRVELANLPR